MTTTSNNVLAIRAALQNSAGAAESQLALIANNAGDHQLAEIVAELNPAEIAVMVADADMTKPSITHNYITPEQFSGAFSRLGSRWSELTIDVDYTPFQRDVEDFLCPMVLSSEDPERRKTMLGALLEHEHGIDALLFLMLGRPEVEGLLKNPTGYPVARGTYQELIALTFEFYPEKFRELARLGLEILGHSTEEQQEFAYTVLSALHDEAIALQTEKNEGAAPEEEFLDI